MNGFGRRALILSALTGLAACAGQAPPAGAGRGVAASVVADPGCNAPPDPARTQYIIGYGSLMQDESRKRTSPQAGPAHPVEVSGYRRGWIARGDPVGYSTTFLGALPDPKAQLNAVIYQVGADELAATDRREASYCRRSVPASDIRALAKEAPETSGGQVWIYANHPGAIATPTARYPIVQSYVDIFVSGCLEQEQRFGLNGFARQCLATTGDWSSHWINDRPYPRRPFIFQPRSRQIDSLLAQQLPEHFARIRFE